MKIIYWSGTGNTLKMAEEIHKSLENSTLVDVSEASLEDVTSSHSLAFGCPSMGPEVLEEEYFEPFFQSIESSLAGKKIILFGSYDWGNGEWMDDWVQRVKQAGGEVLGHLILHLEPTEEGLEECRQLAAKLQ